MKIGLDISIQTCRDEGYMVMEYTVRDFKKDPLNTLCTFTCSYPDYVRGEMGWKVGDSIMSMDVDLDYLDLYEMYIDNQAGIDSFIGGEHKFIENPVPYNLLLLASDINSYCGLE